MGAFGVRLVVDEADDDDDDDDEGDRDELLLLLLFVSSRVGLFDLLRSSLGSGLFIIGATLLKYRFE